MYFGYKCSVETVGNKNLSETYMYYPYSVRLNISFE